MDHLPPVTDPATSKTVIPYLGYLCSFDGTDFCTFPKSKGWKIVSDEVDGDVISRLDGTEPSDEAFAAFIQAWLFFGLVYQYFHNLGISINLDDFIAQGSTESHVTTVALPSMIERLATVEQQVDIATQKPHLRKTLTFLYDVGAVIDNNLSFPYLRYKDDPSTLQKLIIAESIAILGETLMHATKKMWAHLRDDMNEISEGRFYKKFRMAESAALSIKRLELLGWCKSDRIMMSRMVDTMGLAYASQLKRQPTANGHTKCTLYECLELQVDTNSYETQHVTTGCDCGESAVDVQCLVDVIESGCVPKVRVIASNTNQGIQQ